MLPVLRRLRRMSTLWPSSSRRSRPDVADVGDDRGLAVVDDHGGEVADVPFAEPRAVLFDGPPDRSLQAGIDKGAERRRGAGPGRQRVEEVRRLARHGPDAIGHRLREGQAALELGQAPLRPEPPQQPVALGEQPRPPLRRGQQSGIVGQDGQERGLGPAQPLRAPAEVEPGRGVDADDVAAERRVGGEERQDLPLRAPRLEPQGQHGLPHLLQVCPRPVLPGQPDDLHRDRAGAALDLPGADVPAHGPGERQRVDAGMDEEALVLEPDEDAVEAIGNGVAGRESPLPVGRRPRPEELALRAEKDRRDRVLETDDRHGEPSESQQQEGRARDQHPMLQDGDTYFRYSLPWQSRAPRDMSPFPAGPHAHSQRLSLMPI